MAFVIDQGRVAELRDNGDGTCAVCIRDAKGVLAVYDSSAATVTGIARDGLLGADVELILARTGSPSAAERANEDAHDVGVLRTRLCDVERMLGNQRETINALTAAIETAARFGEVDPEALVGHIAAVPLDALRRAIAERIGHEPASRGEG